VEESFGLVWIRLDSFGSVWKFNRVAITRWTSLAEKKGRGGPKVAFRTKCSSGVIAPGGGHCCLAAALTFVEGSRLTVNTLVLAEHFPFQ
jgi:hypothetical protein